MELKALIAECTAYDFKVMLEEKKPKSWLKSVSAFANGLGGSLFFGIDNDGTVKGLEDVQHVCETISSRIRDYMDPLPEVEMIPHDVDGLHILQPVFRSTSSQFMTTIYSMGYEPKNKQDEQYQDGIKSGLSWEQVGTKIGLGWDEVEKLFIALQEPKTMTELKELYQWSNTTKFRTKYVSPLLEAQFVGMTLPNKPTSPKQRYFLTDSEF